MTGPQPPRSGLDAVGTALAAVVIGAATGGALVSLVLAGAYDLPRGPETAFSDVALGAGAGGLALAAGTAATLARPLGPWRAALAAMVAAAGAALLITLTTAADLALGRLGLLALAAVCTAVIVAAHRIFHGRDGAG